MFSILISQLKPTNDKEWINWIAFSLLSKAFLNKKESYFCAA